MNIWDSVHRGLEKASQEAARIAKAQKLRSQIDGLSRQLNTQNTTLLSRAMELFNTNQLTQSQLLPLCQELASLQQQLESAQNELKLLQSQGLPPGAVQTPSAPNTTGTYQISSPYAGGEGVPTTYAPPPPGNEYSPQATQVPPPPPNSGPQTVSAMETLLMGNSPTPPPPPNSGPQTVSAMETLLMGNSPTPPPPPPFSGSTRCTNCQSEVASGLSYCPNCGKPVQESPIAHLPTMRGGTLEPFYPPGQETVRNQPNTGQKAEQGVSGHIADQETRRASETSSIDEETVRSEPPPFGHIANTKDGGL